MTEKSRPFHGDSHTVLIIHDIRSVYNVGALLRTADAVGINSVVFSGYSPTPIDRFGRIRTDIAKSALGAEQTIPWEYYPDPILVIKNYQDQGYVVVGVEQDKRSIDYKQVVKTEKMVFVIGTETTGMIPELRDVCDVLCEIPMQGTKESLNVSVATGIVLYRVLDKNE